MKLLGLDIGTTSICATILDTRVGAVIESITRPNDAQIRVPGGASFRQDPERIWAIVASIVTDVSTRYPDLSGIGVTGQMHGILYLDANGGPVSPLFTWQDQSGEQLFTDDETFSQALSRLTGQALATGYGLVTCFFHTHHRLVSAEASSLCTIADFIVLRLTGRTKPITDATNADSVGGFINGKFHLSAIATAGIQTDLLPDVVSDWTIAGETATGIVVTVALGDNQASFLGAAPSPRDTLLVNVGTSGQVCLWSESPINVSGWDTRPFPGGHSMLVGATLSGGKSYALLAQFFHRVCQLFANVEPSDLFAKMGEVVANGGTYDLPSITPQFYGTRSDPRAKAVVSNLSDANFTPEALILGMVEGIARELHQFVYKLPPSLRSDIRHLVGAGNGMRKNLLLRDAVERQFGIPLELPLHDEEAALGAALYVAAALGEFIQVKGAGWMRRE